MLLQIETETLVAYSLCCNYFNGHRACQSKN